MMDANVSFQRVVDTNATMHRCAENIIAIASVNFAFSFLGNIFIILFAYLLGLALLSSTTRSKEVDSAVPSLPIGWTLYQVIVD